MKKVIDLYKIGEKIEFYDMRETTNGRRSEGKVTLQAGKKGPPSHCHPSCEEGFEVLSGTLILILNGKEITLQKGDVIVVKRGELHTFKNASTTNIVEARFWYEPALRLEWMLQTLGEDAMENGGDWKNASLLSSMFIMFKLREEHRMGAIPIWLQDIIFGIGAAVAVLAGSHKKLDLPPALL